MGKTTEEGNSHTTMLEFSDEILKAKNRSGLTWKMLVVLGLKYVEERRANNMQINELKDIIQKQNNRISAIEGFMRGLKAKVGLQGLLRVKQEIEG